VLDVAFGEDLSQKRSGHAAQNFSVVNRIALSAAQAGQNLQTRHPRQTLLAAWDHQYILHLLGVEN